MHVEMFITNSQNEVVCDFQDQTNIQIDLCDAGYTEQFDENFFQVPLTEGMVDVIQKAENWEGCDPEKFAFQKTLLDAVFCEAQRTGDTLFYNEAF